MDIGLGIRVELNPEEALGVIPKIQKLLSDKIKRQEQEVIRIAKIRNEFDEKLTKLKDVASKKNLDN